MMRYSGGFGDDMNFILSHNALNSLFFCFHWLKETHQNYMQHAMILSIVTKSMKVILVKLFLVLQDLLIDYQ